MGATQFRVFFLSPSCGAGRMPHMMLVIRVGALFSIVPDQL